MPFATAPLVTTPLSVLANLGARQLHLPPELAPDLAAGEEGVSKFILQHPIGRESFEHSLTPAALALWREKQSSAEDPRKQIATLEQESAAQPGTLAAIWRDPKERAGIVGGLLGGMIGSMTAGLCGDAEVDVFAGLFGGLIGGGIFGGIYSQADGEEASLARAYMSTMAGVGAGVLAGIVRSMLYAQGVDPTPAFLGSYYCAVVVGPILGAALAAIAISGKERLALQESHAKIASDIAVRQELIRGYEDFLANGSRALAEHPEIYDDYLKHCLEKIDAKIGDIKSRCDGLTRELVDIKRSRDTTMTREFNDESLRATALSGLDDDAERVRQSIAQLEQWEVVLNGLKGAYEGYREAYSGKLKSYRAKLDDVNYMRSLSIKSKGTHDAIAKAEAQIRADLVELVAMIQTTRELEARQLAAIEVELAGT